MCTCCEGHEAASNMCCTILCCAVPCCAAQLEWSTIEAVLWMPESISTDPCMGALRQLAVSGVKQVRGLHTHQHPQSPSSRNTAVTTAPHTPQTMQVPQRVLTEMSDACLQLSTHISTHTLALVPPAAAGCAGRRLGTALWPPDAAVPAGRRTCSNPQQRHTDSNLRKHRARCR